MATGLSQIAGHSWTLFIVGAALFCAEFLAIIHLIKRWRGGPPASRRETLPADPNRLIAGHTGNGLWSAG